MLSKLCRCRIFCRPVALRVFATEPKPPRGFEKFYRKSKPEAKVTEEKAAGATPSEAKAPEVKAPEPKAPEASETKAPEAPETKTPETPKGPKIPDDFTHFIPLSEMKRERPKDKSESANPDDKSEQEEPKKKHAGAWFSDSSKDFRSQRPKLPKLPNPLWLVAAGVGAFFALSLHGKNTSGPTLTFQDLVDQFIETDQVRRIIVHSPASHKQTMTLFDVTVVGRDEEVIGRLKVPDVNAFLKVLEAEQVRRGRDRAHLVPIEYSEALPRSGVEATETALKGLVQLSNLLFIGFIFWQLIRLTKGPKGGQGGGSGGGGFDLFNMNRSNFKVYGTDIKIDTRFKDVAGLKEAKMEITEFVDFLKQPQRFKKLGAKIPKGALLVGPPGTGKTLLAKAAAGEAGVPFFAASGSDFVEMFVGLGASRVRQLFKQAKERAPSIIFIDEIDAVGRKRHGKAGGNEERDQTLNQLLVEMDGFGTETNVVVLAGTNRKDILDSALLRPGRFDRTIELTLPDIESREEILKIHLAPIKLNPDVLIGEFARRLAALSPGFSGADLANLCNEAAIMAARRDKSFVDREDFENAAERVIGGLEKTKKLSKEEREVVATHEAGHAVAGWFLEGADPLLKVSILPRSKGALGFAQFLPNETSLLSKSELLDKICATLSGRAAEELIFGRVTTGAQDDLLRATQIANAVVASLGMSERLGVVGYNMEQEAFNKPYSEDTNAIIDDEVRKIVVEGLHRATALLTEKKELVTKLAEKLLEKERLVQKDLVEILGPRPFALSPEYDRYVNEEAAKPSSEAPETDRKTT